MAAKVDQAKTQRAGCMGCLTFLVLVVIVVAIISAASGKGSKSGCEGPAFKSEQACEREARSLKHAEKPSAAYAADYLGCMEAIGSKLECEVSMRDACEASGLHPVVCYHGEQQANASEEAVKHAEHGELDGATPQERALEAVEE